MLTSIARASETKVPGINQQKTRFLAKPRKIGEAWTPSGGGDGGIAEASTDTAARAATPSAASRVGSRVAGVMRTE